MNRIAILFMAVFMVMGLGIAGCDPEISITGDEKGDGQERWSAWTETEDQVTFTPTICFYKWYLLSHSDIWDANEKLDEEPTREKIREIGRWLLIERKWVLTDYSPVPHKYYPFKTKIGDVWVDRTKPITLELQATIQPRRVQQNWVPNDGTDPENPVDDDNTSTWGHWEDVEPEWE